MTPRAEVVSEPATRRRFGQATFRWRGGDPLADAPPRRRRDARAARARALAHGRDDDSYLDTVERGDDGVWTERLQLDWCAPRGCTVRRHGLRRPRRGFCAVPGGLTRVQGAAERAAAGRHGPLRRRARARPRALYPAAARGALLALPRRVLTGWAELRCGRAGAARGRCGRGPTRAGWVLRARAARRRRRAPPGARPLREPRALGGRLGAPATPAPPRARRPRRAPGPCAPASRRARPSPCTASRSRRPASCRRSCGRRGRPGSPRSPSSRT